MNGGLKRDFFIFVKFWQSVTNILVPSDLGPPNLQIF